MYLNNDEYKGKVGRVTIDCFKNKYIRLRWTTNGQRYNLTIGEANKLCFKAAIAKAQQIDADITLEKFDSTLAKYSHKHAQRLEEVSKPTTPTINELWLKYTESEKDNVSHSYRLTQWRTLNNLLTRLNECYHATDDGVKTLVEDALQHYSKGTMIKVIWTLSACLNWSKRQGYNVANPCSEIKEQLTSQLPKKQIECFTMEEVKIILEAFKNDTYCSNNTVYKHSYYYGYVSCLALTGMRPEEAIALTWDDVINQGKGKIWLKVNKVFTRGKLSNITKNKTDRAFPVNVQLLKIIETYGNKHHLSNTNDLGLIFPSVKGKYIDQRNFLTRYWTKVVKGLVQDGLISQYLPCYALRATFITYMIRNGTDIATVARLVGNTPETIMSNYLSANNSTEIPEFNL